MHTFRKYSGFGVHILSEFELPELFEHEFPQPDVTIRLSHIADTEFPGTGSAEPFSSFTEKEYLLSLPGVARYRVRNGTEIEISPLSSSDPASIRLFLLSMVLPAALNQQQKILIHASAVIVNGKANFFIGHSRAGKSSLVASLKSRGYRVFSDDVCVLEKRRSDGQVQAYASYPMMKLWEETVDMLADPEYRKHHRIRPQLTKFGQFFHEDFDTQPYLVGRIYIINPHEDEGDIYRHKPLGGLEAFEKLSKHTYRSQFVKSESHRIIHLGIMSQLVRQSPITDVYRHKTKSTIQDFSEYMVQLFSS
jgi:hypothetical protein